MALILVDVQRGFLTGPAAVPGAAGLTDLLTTRGVTRLVLAGLLSEMCVSATARGALARGLQVVLPHPRRHLVSLDSVKFAGGR